jgi:adenylate cyclase
MGDLRFKEFLKELRRRRVYRVAVVYVVVAWALLQLGNIVVEPLLLPPWTMTLLIVFVSLGFPLALILAWAFDITPEGVRRTPSQRLGEGTEEAPVPRPLLPWLAGGGLLVMGALAALLLFRGAPDPGPLEGASEDGVRALAILPFANASPDPDNGFFADGVTDDIITNLSRIRDFAVTSRTTAMRYKASTQSIPEIASELGVAYVLEGSVRRAQDRVRISVQLVEAATDQPVWAESYDRGLEDIFAVQSEIARAIVGALEAELSRSEEVRIEQRPTENLEAYDLFLRGREAFYRYDVAGTEEAIRSLRRALELDPGFAMAQAWLARTFAIYSFNHGAGQEWGDSAVAQGRAAVDRQPELSDAHTALGTALAVTGRYREAQAALERAMELNPGDWATWGNLGLVYTNRGQLDEAIRLTRRSLEREAARSQIAYGNLGSYYQHLGLYEQAEAALERAVGLDPNHWTAQGVLAQVHIIQGRLDQALNAADRIARGAGQDPRALGTAGAYLLVLGEKDRALPLVERAYGLAPTGGGGLYLPGVIFGYALQTLAGPAREAEAREAFALAEAHARERIEGGDEAPWLRFNLAAIHTARGERSEAIGSLQEAVRLGWRNGGWLRVDPLLADLRHDPALQEILDRIEEHVAPMRERVLREGW